MDVDKKSLKAQSLMLVMSFDVLYLYISRNLIVWQCGSVAVWVPVWQCWSFCTQIISFTLVMATDFFMS